MLILSKLLRHFEKKKTLNNWNHHSNSRLSKSNHPVCHFWPVTGCRLGPTWATKSPAGWMWPPTSRLVSSPSFTQHLRAGFAPRLCLKGVRHFHCFHNLPVSLRTDEIPAASHVPSQTSSEALNLLEPLVCAHPLHVFPFYTCLCHHCAELCRFKWIKAL